jgi:hypothetical protein
MAYESIQLTRAISDDFDDQAAMLKGWDQCYTQLEAGGFEATVQAAARASRGQYRAKRFGKRVRELGKPLLDHSAVACSFIKTSARNPGVQAGEG